MADHSKHEHGLRLRWKTKARQQVEAEFTLHPVSAKAIETACCGHKSREYNRSADQGCYGGSRAKRYNQR